MLPMNLIEYSKTGVNLTLIDFIKAKGSSDYDQASLSDNDLEKAKREFLDNPFSPEANTHFWRKLIETKLKDKELPFEIPECTKTSAEIKSLMENGRFLVFNPGFDLKILTEIFSISNFGITIGTLPEDDFSKAGWLDVEFDPESPNKETTEEELRVSLAVEQRIGQRLSTYLWASLANKVITGHYFDEESKSRLLSTHSGSKTVYVHSLPNGNVDVYSILNPQNYGSGLGGRSESS
jgi:hypothetical protein